MEDLTTGNNPSTQGYEPNRAELELVQAQRLTLYTPRARQGEQQALLNCERTEHLMLSEYHQFVSRKGTKETNTSRRR
eukprot:12907371-Prorocentrum_lima.AAC.1